MRAGPVFSLILLLGHALLAQGDRAPVLRNIDGGALAPFHAMGGQAAIAFFVATDCPVSNSYAPVIQRICREYGPRSVSCSLLYEDVDTYPTAASLDGLVRAHLQEYGYRDIPAAIDRDRRAATFAGATITPQAVVVDRTGQMRYRGRIDNLYAALGTTRLQVTSHDLRDSLEAVLAGRPVASPRTEAIGCFIVDPSVLRTHEHE